MKRVVVSGATGFVGREVVQAALGRGDEVVALTRDPGRARSSLPEAVRRVAWDATSVLQESEVGTCDAVVHLAGEPAVGARWTEQKKRQILESRAGSTEALVRSIEGWSKRPSVLVCASGVGHYGAHGDEPVDETGAPGSDFLAHVTVKWEEAARRAEALGVRVVLLRLGIVLGRGGGALREMVLPFRFFAGGPIGSGRQMVSWIHLGDAAHVILRAIDDERLRGPVNTATPHAVTNAELARAIGRATGRPSWLKVPEAALRLRFGEGADPLVTGVNAVPRALEAVGFEWRYPRIDEALAEALAPGG